MGDLTISPSRRSVRADREPVRKKLLPPRSVHRQYYNVDLFGAQLNTQATGFESDCARSRPSSIRTAGNESTPESDAHYRGALLETGNNRDAVSGIDLLWPARLNWDRSRRRRVPKLGVYWLGR